MGECEAIDGRGVVVADFPFCGVEAHALADDGGLGTVVAPDGVGELESDGEGAVGAGAGA